MPYRIGPPNTYSVSDHNLLERLEQRRRVDLNIFHVRGIHPEKPFLVPTCLNIVPAQNLTLPYQINFFFEILTIFVLPERNFLDSKNNLWTEEICVVVTKRISLPRRRFRWHRHEMFSLIRTNRFLSVVAYPQQRIRWESQCPEATGIDFFRHGEVRGSQNT